MLYRKEFNSEDMAVVSAKDTKLPYDICIFSDEVENVYFIPYLAVKIDEDSIIPVSIDDEPVILVRDKRIVAFDVVSRWIIKYKDVLMDHWYGLTTDREALNMLNE